MLNEEAHELLGRIDAKVDILLERTAGHDRSIKALERRQWFQTGAIAACVALIAPKLKMMLGI